MQGGVLIYLTVDRFEGNLAVCVTDGGEVRALERASLGFEVSEGDVLLVSDGGENAVLGRDDDEKLRRERRIQNKFEKLKRRCK